MNQKMLERLREQQIAARQNGRWDLVVLFMDAYLSLLGCESFRTARLDAPRA
jgi:hypothetical protein